MVEERDMTEKQNILLQGMDMLLEKFNVYPNDKAFTVEEIIGKSNEVHGEILGRGDVKCCKQKSSAFRD